MCPRVNRLFAHRWGFEQCGNNGTAPILGSACSSRRYLSIGLWHSPLSIIVDVIVTAPTTQVEFGCAETNLAVWDGAHLRSMTASVNG